MNINDMVGSLRFMNLCTQWTLNWKVLGFLLFTSSQLFNLLIWKKLDLSKVTPSHNSGLMP